MIDRRTFLAGTGVVLLGAPLIGEAQSPSKVPRIGYLDSGVAGSGDPLLEAFRQGLHDLGWVEGRNLVVEVRSAEGRYNRLPELAAELVRFKVDVIVVSSTPAAVAAKQATTTIPIVIGRVADPVGSGLVATLAHPGGNITGWTHQGLEMRVKYLDLLKEAVPTATRIGILWNPRSHPWPSLKSIEATAQALKVELYPEGVQEPSKIQSAFSALVRRRVQALAVFLDGMFLEHGQQIIALAARRRIPAIYGATELASAGGLMGYGVNLPDMYRRGAYFVDRILKGEKPADLPVEQPTKFELMINLKTAKALGLTIPPSLLGRADEVIQ